MTNDDEGQYWAEMQAEAAAHEAEQAAADAAEYEQEMERQQQESPDFGYVVSIAVKKDAGLTKDDIICFKHLAEQLGCNKMTVGYFKPTQSAMGEDKTVTFEAPMEHWRDYVK